MQASGVREGSAQAFKSDDGKSQNIDTMLDFNALQFEMAPDLSVATDRTFKEHFFQKNDYSPGETAFCILNSGADFIDGRNSYLSFNIKPVISGSLPTNAGENPTFNQAGSVLQTIRSITITDRAGNEIERIQDVGRLADILVRNSYSHSWMKTYGRSLGFQASDDISSLASEQGTGHNSPARWPIDADTNVPVSQEGTSRGFAIPLRFLSGLFDFSQLLPAQLMSGLRFEIQFANPEKALQFPNDGANRNLYLYTFNNVRIVADSVKLTDSIARELNERAANDGLEIMFRTWFTQQFTESANPTRYNIEVRKAVSRAFGAIAHFEPTRLTLDAAAFSDSTQTHPYDFKTWQWRAGNLYFPQQELRQRQSFQLLPVNEQFAPTLALTSLPNPAPLGPAETFNHIQRLFGKNHEMFSENDMNFLFYEPSPPSAFSGILTAGNALTAASELGAAQRTVGVDMALLPLDLERSTVQDLSGIPLNNSRVLALDFELNVGISGAVTVWLQHLKVARVFMDNTEIEE